MMDEIFGLKYSTIQRFRHLTDQTGLSPEQVLDIMESAPIMKEYRVKYLSERIDAYQRELRELYGE